MADVFESATAKFAGRTSRRSFLGRGGAALLTLVGGSALAASAKARAASPDCSCSNPCQFNTCDCVSAPSGSASPAVTYTHHYLCPDCSGSTCSTSYCTNIFCHP